MEFARLNWGLVSTQMDATNSCCLWSKMYFPFSEYLTEMGFGIRKSLPNMRGPSEIFTYNEITIKSNIY